jgi:cob(I)alamin adenosyltransferase
MKKNLGLVHIYTGNGKGKTSWAMGLSLRAIGQGLKVNVIQFMKGGAYTGEFISAQNFLPNIEFSQFGKKCVKEQKQLKLTETDSGVPFFDYVRDDIECGDCRECFVNDKDAKELIDKGFALAKKATTSGEYDLVVLDEINVAVAFKFLPEARVVDLIKNKFKNTELVLTGRGASKGLMDVADYVSIVKMQKHPFNKGILARRGIEY